MPLSRNEKARKVRDKAGNTGEMPVVAETKANPVGEYPEAVAPYR